MLLLLFEPAATIGKVWSGKVLCQMWKKEERSGNRGRQWELLKNIHSYFLVYTNTVQVVKHFRGRLSFIIYFLIFIIYFLIFLLIEWTRAAWEFFPSHIKGQFKSSSQWRMFSMNTKSLYGPTESESTQEIGKGAKIVTLWLFKVYMAWIPFFCLSCSCRMETSPVQSFEGKNSSPAVAWNAIQKRMLRRIWDLTATNQKVGLYLELVQLIRWKKCPLSNKNIAEYKI